MPDVTIPFQGLELIPALNRFKDADNETVFEFVEGNCPVIICAAHSGTPALTPAGAKVFGHKADFEETSDENTLAITYGIVRTLASLGAIPYAIISHVSRKYIDLNRTLSRHRWTLGERTFDPSTVSPTFLNTYYQSFHDKLRSFTTLSSPDGWLFDIHGKSISSGDLIIFSGYGYYARQDFVYDNRFISLHHYLKQQGFALIPANPSTADEATAPQIGKTVNLISGGRYGARFLDPSVNPIPFSGIVRPTEAHRVHGIQFELSGELRKNRPVESLESVGINIAYGIYNCLLGNDILTKTTRSQAEDSSGAWYSLFQS